VAVGYVAMPDHIHLLISDAALTSWGNLFMYFPSLLFPHII
jgi:hypothetical protein